MSQRLVHSVFSWLFLTENWIYTQVKNINAIEQLVITDRLSPEYPTGLKIICKKDMSIPIINRVNQKISTVDWFRKSLIRKDDILFSHYGTRGYHDLGLSKKHITRFYGYDLKRIIKTNINWAKRYERLYSECEFFVAEGPYMKKQLIEGGCHPDKIYVNPLGCTNLNIDHSIRIYDGGIFNFLIASSFCERKGIIYSLEALGHLKAEKRIGDFHIDIVGEVPDKEAVNIQYKEKMLQKIKEYKLEENITWHGYMPLKALHGFALKNHVLLHPSVWGSDEDSEGGYPIVIPELMATGLPVVASDHCDIPTAVNETNGFVCREKDIDGLMNAILKIMEPGTLSSLSAGARITAETKFNQQILSAELQSFILSSFRT
jgi:colanic acid/amylovoran biosynthesis glycosyltransferase